MNVTYHAGYHLTVEKNTVYRCARCHQTNHTSECFQSISKYGKPRWRQTSTPTGRIVVEYQGRTMGRWTDEAAAEAARTMQVAREACVAAGFKVTDNGRGTSADSDFTVEAQS